MTRTITLMLAVALLGLSTTAQAQPVFDADAGQVDLYTLAGLDDALVTTTLGAALALGPVGPLERLGLEVAMPLFAPSIDDLRLRATSRWEPLRLSSRLRLPVVLTLAWVQTDNDVFRAHALGTELGLAPRWQGRAWSAGADLLWRQTWWTHLAHSDYYRESFFAQARDGWYRMGSTRLRAGLSAAWRPSRRTELSLRAGWERQGRFNVLLPPFYGLLGFALRL